MAQVTLTIYIEAADALAARRSQCGAIPVRLTDDDIRAMSDAQITTMQRHLRGEPGPFVDGPHWADPIWQHASETISVADVPTLLRLLDRRWRIMHDSMALADCEVYSAKVGDGEWSAPMAAADALALYRTRGDGTARINRCDGVSIARSANLQYNGETIDVAAQKIWHRVAAGVKVPRSRNERIAAAGAIGEAERAALGWRGAEAEQARRDGAK